MRYAQKTAWSEIALKVNLEESLGELMCSKRMFQVTMLIFSDSHSQFATDFKIKFRIPKCQHHIVSIIGNIYCSLKY